MCGISGIVALDGVDFQSLIDMTEMVSYRGPSGFGYAYINPGLDLRPEIYLNENRGPQAERAMIGLGTRRLAILDVSPQGNQPMMIDDGNYCITFNGEVYNYKEIRDELKHLGNKFRTGTDTEVILTSYKQWGEECLLRFNGMWAFALWDRPNQRLFCARDRFGVKPFYYSVRRDSFAFGSEIKQVLRGSNIARVANSRAVYPFLEWGLVDHTAETFFEDVFQLTAGHSLTLELSSPLTPQINRYWDLQLKPEIEMSPESATEKFIELFENAVKIRLRSDVPVGVCLSGGLDSSSIACEAKEISPSTRFETFSACFEDNSIDEREYIAAAVSATNSIGHSAFPQARGFWSQIEKILFHHDEPLASAGAFAQWSVMADAHAAGVPVLLGGQGGDEILCGYQKYRYFYLWDLLRSGNLSVFRELALFARNGTPFKWTPEAASRYLPKMLIRPASATQRLGTPEMIRSSYATQLGLGADSSISARQKLDLTYASIPALVHYEDRNSMAHSIESRLPFLDYRLAEFSVNCSTALKLRGGWSKWLLRSAMKGKMPEKIRLRKTKLGFSTPDAPWLQYGLQNGHRQFTEKPQLRMSRFMEAPKFVAECRKFLAGSGNALPVDAIFRAVSLELWSEAFQVS